MTWFGWPGTGLRATTVGCGVRDRTKRASRRGGRDVFPMGIAARPGRTAGVKRKTSLAFALLLAAGLGGCGRKIGDKCKDALDCNSEDNTRSCDVSQPAGYCTIEGCNEISCPGEAVCVRFFPKAEFLTEACDPTNATACDPTALCVNYPEGGRCVPRSTERDNCLLRCDDDGDCRDEYACRASGQGTSLSLTPTPDEVVKYCAAR